MTSLPHDSKEIEVAQSEILRVPQAVTGLWLVNERDHASFNDRVQKDVCYVRDWSVWSVLMLLVRTRPSYRVVKVAERNSNSGCLELFRSTMGRVQSGTSAPGFDGRRARLARHTLQVRCRIAS
jgi:Bacterial sugar transferase